MIYKGSARNAKAQNEPRPMNTTMDKREGSVLVILQEIGQRKARV